MSGHPSPTELKALVLGGITKRRIRAVTRHLCRGCRDCLEVVDSVLHLAFGAGPAEATAERVEAYDAPVERAIAKAARHQRYLQTERAKIPRVLELLDELGLQELVMLPPKGYGGLALVEALLARSWELRRENPAEMVRLARGACIAALGVDKRRLGRQRWFDLQARAWSEAANAHRAADQLIKAGECFDKAFVLLPLGTGDPALACRLNDYQASYYGTLRWFKLALKSLEQVYAFHAQAGDTHLAGRALVKKALYSTYSGEPESALALLDEALPHLDEERDPELVSDAMGNRIRALIDCGRFLEARRALFENASRFERFAGSVHRVKLTWLRATVDAGLGAYASAERGFLEARSAMEKAGMGFHSALVCLELSVLLLRQGRLQDARREAQVAAEVFRSLEVHVELLVAMGVVKRSFELNLASVTLLESVVEFARRAEHDPSARFEPRF